ncbi:hypothetical protein [Microbulbifer sp. THAF38]|uniref:hypothetical protein n=1 Tax=Microbulbifer sp. THAF38 TaxID=2587856 RepID=UPI0012697573|nr:hypothetical protein [Microbulbifer sp. THAF38]QFT56159.1 hypothetical protein FIU95_16540 [Microbulbifer sp. THAF38]
MNSLDNQSPIGKTLDHSDNFTSENNTQKIPKHLRPMFLFVNSWIEEQEGPLTVSIGGSIASCEADVFSDLDFTFIFSSNHARDLAKIHFEQSLNRHFSISVSFTAEHAGLPNLLVFYSTDSNWVVKLDVSFETCVGPHYSIPAPQIFLRKDIPVQLSKKNYNTPLSVEYILRRYCGWLWFTHTKIKRGEYLAACDSLAFTRKHAIVPLIQMATGTNLQGDRRLEERLPTSWVEQLHQSHPTRLTEEDLQSSQLTLHQIFLRALKGARQNHLLIKNPQYKKIIDILRQQGLSLDWPN